MNKNTILCRSARAGLELLDPSDNCMPAGHNGPWNDPDTPLRNTGHWLITFASAYEVSGEEDFKQAAETCLEYLLKPTHRPGEQTFLHRKSENKDNCNGLVGQAWTIESLATAYNILDSSRAADLAIEVINQHPFDDEAGLWESVDINGETHGIHSTINQQIYFAAAASHLLDQHKEIETDIRQFLDSLQHTLQLRSSGRIVHNGYSNLVKTTKQKELQEKVLGWGRRSGWKVYDSIFRSNEVLEMGYHSFNLFGLSILKQNIPDHGIWESEKIKKPIEYISSPTYKDGVSNNVYSFQYNPTGIENALVCHEFGSDENLKFWLNEQFRRCYDVDKDLHCQGWDQNTLSARIYEITYLPDVEIPAAAKNSNLDVKSVTGQE